MDEPMNYALVSPDGVVENIIWLCAGNEGDFPNAVCAEDLPVAIGDCYINGVFTRAGVPVLTQAEQEAAIVLP